MYTQNEVLKDYNAPYPLEQIAPLDKILFLDIETTGLNAAYCPLYMIGLNYYEDGNWHILQWMAEAPQEEKELLDNLVAFLPRFTHIFHFNGTRFDIPYLLERAEILNVPLSFDAYEGLDIYKCVSPLKNLLGLPNCKQKSIEVFLGIDRIDQYSGGELIEVYKDYVAHPNDEALHLLIQHNYDDMKGMLDIVPILAYCDLLEASLPISRVEMQKSTRMDGTEKYELSMTLKLPFTIPQRLFAHHDGNFILMQDETATIKVPVIQDELKFFYANYKDYHYVPSVDAAYHKSITAHLDASLRQQATATTCYTKVSSIFLKQYDVLVEPFFKRDYKDKESYFEITDETKKDRKLFEAYANHILQVVCGNV